MQARIQKARRDAEFLKDQIKKKKDQLADTTCTYWRLCQISRMEDYKADSI